MCFIGGIVYNKTSPGLLDPDATKLNALLQIFQIKEKIK